MQSMATHTAALSPSYILNCKAKPSPPPVLLPQTLTEKRPSYNSLVFQVFQLKGRYKKDDVVAEWTEVNGSLKLQIPHIFQGTATGSRGCAIWRLRSFQQASRTNGCCGKSLSLLYLKEVQSSRMLGAIEGCCSGKSGQDKWICICKQGKGNFSNS